MNRAAGQRLRLESACAARWTNGEFVLHYQPQVDMRAAASSAWKR